VLTGFPLGEAVQCGFDFGEPATLRPQCLASAQPDDERTDRERHNGGGRARRHRAHTERCRSGEHDAEDD
jgi:hypothetical protein